MTQDYYGTKRISAVPMTRGEYNAYRGWAHPNGEDQTVAGYLVEYRGDDANHPQHRGYISWSPKAAFDAAYQPITSMGFGHALAALKSGDQVARAGWNGKGMFLWMEPGATADRRVGVAIGGVSSGHFLLSDQGATTRMPHLCMRAADGSTVVGWLASQTDMLAEDWTIVEP